MLLTFQFRVADKTPHETFSVSGWRRLKKEPQREGSSHMESLIQQIGRIITPNAYVRSDKALTPRFVEWQAEARRSAEAKAIEILKVIRGTT